MELLDLPSELILAFGDCADPPSLSALASTSRWLHFLLNPLLYRRNAKEQQSAALIWAAENGRVDTATLCLAHGADVNTALAPGKDDQQVREERSLLWGRHANFNPGTQTRHCLKYSTSGTPLHYAVRRGHDDLVRYLLANGADHQCWCTNLCGCVAPTPDSRTINHLTAILTSHWSPLHLAICNHRDSTAKILIDWGVSCESTFQQSWDSGRRARAQQLQPSLNAMHEIAIHGSLDILNSLIFSKNRAETMINSVSFDGNTPLHFLATRWPSGSAELFLRLLSVDPDLDIPNNDLLRPIDCFVDEGNISAAGHLFELGSRPYNLNRCILSACKIPDLRQYSQEQKSKRIEARNIFVMSLINHALEVGQLSRNVGEDREVSLVWFEIFQLACFQPSLLRELLGAELKPDSLTGDHSVLLRVLEIMTGLPTIDDLRSPLFEAIRILTRAGERWDRSSLYSGQRWHTGVLQRRTPLDQLVKHSDSVAPGLRTALFNSLLGSRPPERTGAEQAHLNQLSEYALSEGKMEIYRHLVMHGAKNPSVYPGPTHWKSSTVTKHQGSVALHWFKPDLKVVTANRLGMSMGRSI